MKVCWLSHHMATPKAFLDSIIKMTPNCSGKWKDMEATLDPKEADFIFVMDGWEQTPLPLERTIFFAEHPKCLPSFNTFDNYKNRALLCLPLHKFLNPGEWWLDYDYDYLTTLRNPNKTKNTICCFTAKTTWPMYQYRIKFVSALLQKYPQIDLYGRPAENFMKNSTLSQYYKGVLGKENPNGKLGEHQTGKEVFINYRYSFEFDVGPTRNYFSERVYDCLLLWCMPIYWGSNNLGDYLPSGCFHYVAIDDVSEDSLKRTIGLLEGVSREENIYAIAEARDKLLNKYQMWAYMYDVVHNLDTYREKWLNNSVGGV